ncbi:hypothetical protein HG15A2_24100 [Adhaeretor mobilis]|uniref:Uncharacterized protein n=1 Tax=Adhaeretor mobilis TaxID=1930276 RepID=A0A517MW70_9BACT|nr:hypothetical protein HG15A2_24100 [Adhaeretor mobilis]
MAELIALALALALIALAVTFLRAQRLRRALERLLEWPAPQKLIHML